MRDIKYIVIHYSATPEGREHDVDDIRRWHVNDRKFLDIGYHYVIKLDGTIQEGRPLIHQGAHVKNYNRHSIGICYIGGLNEDFKSSDTRTPEQKESLLKLIKTLKKDYPNAEVLGHKDLTNTLCPGFNVIEEYSKI